MGHQIFVSYSRRDAALVAPIVKLLRSTNDWVFLDTDDIQTGKKWREEIDAALSRATLVVVFWCRHSQSSAEVKKEYRAAVRAQKEVIPLLLDSTTPPRALAQYQWLDFRAVVQGKHDTDSETALRANLVPWVALWLAAAGLMRFGWTPFSETTTLIVLTVLVLAVSLVVIGIRNRLDSRLMRALRVRPGGIRQLEAEIQRRLEVLPDRDTIRS